MKRKLFCFNVTKETYIAIATGILAILLSLLLNIKFVDSNPFLYILFRDILMIFGIGIFFVITRINKDKDTEYGLTSNKWKRNIFINVLLASTLAYIMISGLDNPKIVFNTNVVFSVVYIMIAGIFEVLFYYTYQRVIFEKSFGIIPSMIIVSLFYSLHHVGFQPEFLKLFFVGISFVLVVAITQNSLSIYPFYWGVGASVDVLMQSEVVKDLNYPAIRSSILIVIISIYFFILYKKYSFGKSS